MGDAIGVYILTAYGQFVIIPAGIVSGIGNLYYVSESEKPSTSWLAAGFASGIVNIFSGTVWMMGALDAEDDSLFLGLAITNFALGAMDLGFTIWAIHQPTKETRKVTLTPLIMPDARGRPAVGVGLRLVNW